MLTKIVIRNFKLFREVEIPLGNGFVFIGQNNSGKTSALQALTLWHIGLQKWAEKRLNPDGTKTKEAPEKRPGVTVHRRDLLALPMPRVNFLWRDCQVRKGAGANQSMRIDLVVHGVTDGKDWECGLEFDYSDQDSFFCRPLRIPAAAQNSNGIQRMPVPQDAVHTNVAFLPPMSGLASVEALIRQGRVNVLLGEGRTAEVLRNLCFNLADQKKDEWEKLTEQVGRLFGVTLHEPEFLESRGEIVMTYEEQSKNVKLDLQSAGRGMQQVMLLLAFLYTHPHAVFLLDEPDAHLEILRQQQIYDALNEIAESQNSQVIAASHSEVLLNKAAQNHAAVAFVGRPHILGANKKSQVLKALRDIGFEYYYHAETRGWMLYLEGETDRKILKAFADILKHPAAKILDSPPIKYLGTNLPKVARDHFYGLQEAKSNLVGIMLIDRVDKNLDPIPGLEQLTWRQREIENYLCFPDAILGFIASRLRDDLWGAADKDQRHRVMKEEIDELARALSTLGKPEPFSPEIKSSDEFLAPLFANYARRIESHRPLEKSEFHKLVKFVPIEKVDKEVTEKLDAIVRVAENAKPNTA